MRRNRIRSLLCGLFFCPGLAFVACSAAGDGAVQAVQSVGFEIGNRAPDFTRPGLLDDGMLTLSDLRGKVVFVDFWDSWCAPCRESLPAMSMIRDGLPRQDFEVVAVNLDVEPDDGRRFLTQRPVSFPVVSDGSLGLVPIYGVEHLPTSFLLDRDGIIRYVHRGKVDMGGVTAAIAALMKD